MHRPARSQQDPRHVLGRRAEELVVEHLRAQGYAILAQNARVGRRELDIVARRGGTYVFCEVRARKNSDFVSPLETLDARKLQRVREAALGWLAARRLFGRAMRFDAAAVTIADGVFEIDYRSDVF